MVQKEPFLELVLELSSKESASIMVGESEILLQLFDSRSKLSFLTLLYDGEGFIPPAIHEALLRPPSSSSPIHTSLQIDEARGAIYLSYRGALEHLSKEGLKEILESFASDADRWRGYLDENDHRERVPIKRK